MTTGSRNNLEEKFFADKNFVQESVRMAEKDAKGEVSWSVLDLDAEVARINGSQSNNGFMGYSRDEAATERRHRGGTPTAAEFELA